MANVFVNLPAPAANGAGAAVDVSAMAAAKTFVAIGNGFTFEPFVTIEISNDVAGTNFAPIHTFQSLPDNVTIPIVARWARAVVSNHRGGGAPQVDIGADTDPATFVTLVATAGNGSGASVNTSALSEYKTVQVAGVFSGSVNIEISEDGLSAWSTVMAFQAPGVQSSTFTAEHMRVTRLSLPLASGLPIIDLGANSGGSGSGGGVDIQDSGVPIAGNPHSTFNFIGGGVAVTDEGGGVASITIPGFSPARTLFVSPVWPAGVDPLVYFTTVSAALTAAALFASLSNTNPAAIVIYPGTYVENLTLVSNVSMFGTGRFPVTINGNVTWAAGSGVNAPQAALTEQIELVGVAFGLAGTVFTYNSTAKSAGNCVLLAENVNWVGVTATGRNLINSDNFFNYNCNFVFGASAVTFTDMLGAATSIGVEIVATRYRGLAFAGSTIARIQGGEQILRAGSTIALTGTASLELQGVNINNPVSAAAGCIVDASGCNINALLSGAGAFDVRGCDFSGNADLTGITGTCNRTVWTGTTIATTAGVPLVVPLAPAYPNTTNMNVTLQLIAGVGNAGTTVTVKLGASFTVTDAIGGNTFDYTVIHD